MEIRFWQQRWAEEKIGFHLESVNPALVQFWSNIAPPVPARVFIPLAGKSLDMIWLAKLGYEVVAVEVSRLAVESFFKEHDLSPEVTPVGDFSVWQSGRITVICGDFFSLYRNRHQFPDLSQFDIVYDRAAYIALTSQQREVYSRHLENLCPAVPRLLVTLEYIDEQMQGPPFSVTEAEVQHIYAQGDYSIETLSREDVLLDHEHFMAKGMTELYEHVYYLRPLRQER